MKKFIISISLIFVFVSLFSITATATEFTGRYNDYDIGVPAIAGTLEIQASVGDRPWSYGEPLDNVCFTVEPCGRVAKAYYNDLQDVILVVTVDPNQVYFSSNGKATVNGFDYCVEQVKDFYEVRIKAADLLSVPAVAGTLKVEILSGDRIWNVGEPLDNPTFKVEPCGRVINHYKFHESLIFVIEIDPDTVYFVSDGKATVNGKAYKLNQIGDNLYEIETEIDTPETEQLTKTLKIVSSYDIDFICKVTALDENGYTVSVQLITVKGGDSLTLHFPQEVSEIVIQEVCSSGDYVDNEPKVHFNLDKSATVKFQGRGDSYIEIVPETQNQDVVRQIMQLIEDLLCRYRSILKILGK